jgi:hypothetical protein
MKKALLVIMIVLVYGCVPTSYTYISKVVDSDENMVKQCKFVGSFTETANYGGIDRAKGLVEEAAIPKGATNIIWGEYISHSNTISAKAYKCKK